MKSYVVYFFEKKNKTEYLSAAVTIAENSKDACKKVKEWFKVKTGRNAFRPTTKISDDTVKIYEKADRGVTVYKDVI